MRIWPTQKRQFLTRDRAIKAAAHRGLSWTEQALAGLAALPPMTQTVGKHFTYLLTCRRSPLPEPEKHQAWSSVFSQALHAGYWSLPVASSRWSLEHTASP